MSIMHAYDESEEIVQAKTFSEGLKQLPDTAIVCFKKELIDYIQTNPNFEWYSSILECGEEIPIYKTIYEGKEIIMYRTLIGGPATVIMMEELVARGVKNFIFFGACGVLTDMKSGAFLLPTEAYRDEGTSYHYLPVSDFVTVPTAEELSHFFATNAISFEKVKTWTTDALYRETTDKVKERIEAGCQVVEMECASVMAASKLRGWKSYYFLYSEDTLMGDIWNLNELKEDKILILKECLKIALKLATKG